MRKDHFSSTKIDENCFSFFFSLQKEKRKNLSLVIGSFTFSFSTCLTLHKRKRERERERVLWPCEKGEISSLDQPGKHRRARQQTPLRRNCCGIYYRDTKDGFLPPSTGLNLVWGLSAWNLVDKIYDKERKKALTFKYRISTFGKLGREFYAN